MKISQYCSVCKKSLDMEVVPTDDGEDDGVIWLRCPDCGGFLPKIRTSSPLGAQDTDDTTSESHADDSGSAANGDVDIVDAVSPPDESAIPSSGDEPAAGGGPLPKEPKEPKPPEPPEPLDEYAEMLSEQDPAAAVPYRPWNVYSEGDLIHHLAWDDVGVVVAKETLPGNRQVVKVYFEKMGIARLIEGDAKPS